jgi:hypothetical protein
MFLYELCTAAKPFKEKGQMGRFNLTAYVVGGLRPTVPDYVPACFNELMTQCWNQTPEQRPTFKEIVTSIATGQYVFFDTDTEQYENYLDEMLPTVKAAT